MRPRRRVTAQHDSLQGLQFELTESPSATDLDAIGAGLTEYAAPRVDSPGFSPLAIMARRADGSLAGGVSGRINWNWLHVSLLWVTPDLRGSGLGAELLERIEDEAQRRGCSSAHLDTFSFQAKPFYENAGYAVFAVLEDYPPGHQRFFLKKRLGPPDADSVSRALATVSLLVGDYDEAISYYTGCLGFELVEDISLGDGKRWIVVAPPGSRGARLLLARAVSGEQQSRIGNQTGGRVFLFLHTSDFWHDYRAMKSKGVVFLEEPRKEDYGTVVVFEDRYGNRWDLVQPGSVVASGSAETSRGSPATG